MTPRHHVIEIAPKDGGPERITIRTPSEMLADYTPAERVRPSLGLTVDRDTVTHLDLQAFRRRMQDPTRELVIPLDTIRARLAGRLPLRIRPIPLPEGA